MLLIGSSDFFFFPSKFIKQKNRGDPASTSTFFFFFQKKADRVGSGFRISPPEIGLFILIYLFSHI